MRIYKSFSDAIGEVTRDVAEMGIRCHPSSMQNIAVADRPEFETLELLGYSYMIQPTTMKEIQDTMQRLDMPWPYCYQELADRLDWKKLNPGHAWRHRPDVWAPFIDQMGLFDYTYSERMGERLHEVIMLIREANDSRQGVLTIYDGNKDDRYRGGIRRVPCSMHYQFIPRGSSLHLVYVMRSCDVKTHFPIDVALALMLLDYAADELNLARGNFTHQIGSLHMYRKDAEGVF